MTDPSLTLREADDGSLPYVESLLERNGLATDDIADRDALSLYVCYRGDERVGIGGLEVYGTAGLLRSVVVAEEMRGTGIGRALCAELEARASERGVETLYLLTTTARDFFVDLGYHAVDRDEAPPSIRETRQFSELCPSTADCLSTSL
ncbi:MAG: arsenic resistance N-acetyltransferase ArsN2 [Haloarculaceae archaeon]